MILHGRNLIIKAGGVAIAAAKSCDISVQCEETETASPSTGEWRTAIIGRKSWTISTNQLVTSIVRPFSMVGTAVTLSVEIEGQTGKEFSEFLDNPTLETDAATAITGMGWDKTRKKFIAVRWRYHASTLYYDNYSFDGSAAYSSPSDGDMFYYQGKVYTYYNGDLHAEKLTGMANVVTWRVAGTVGNLAQGSFQFNGNGALTPASLPATT